MNGETCKVVLELVEAIAAGDVEPNPAVRGHLETCLRCASALAGARRVEAALASREAPPAPARFTQVVVQRIRRERWRSEQRLDQLFNVAIVIAVVLMAGGIVAALNVGTVLAFTESTWALFRASGVNMLRDAVPAVNTYVMAAALLLSALGMWWWVERRLQF